MSNNGDRYTALSKYLSYLLRHHPEEEGLTLDSRGFTSLQEILNRLRETKYAWADREDIEILIKEGERTRFEIKADKIRALYGHSVDVDMTEEVEPTTALYHGTSPDNIEKIMREGLRPMGRQYVHLTKSIEEGVKIGKRHHPDPVVLKIDAEDASERGVKFYDRGDVILSEKIPAEFIEMISDKSDNEEIKRADISD